MDVAGDDKGVRLHVGNGAVLLREWVNIDLPLPHVFLANERKDLVERFITTEQYYYGRHEDKTPDNLRGGPVTKETVCDVYGSFSFLPARASSVSEILSRQVFEHLDRHEAREAIEECARALQHGGLLRIDIPDADETVRRYRSTGDEFFLRHLFGPRRNEYGTHRHYSRQMLRSLVEERHFDFVEEEESPHAFYPAFTLRFVRK